jgi:hypothetical protein
MSKRPMSTAEEVALIFVLLAVVAVVVWVWA